MSTMSVLRDRLSYFLGYSHEGKRDLYALFGYPRDVMLPELYEMYQRNDIASRIVRAFPQSTWRECPVIRDDKGDSSEEEGDDGKANENFSPFAKAVEEFFTKHDVIRYLERADRLSSIGRFGLLVLGFKDGMDMAEPLSGRKAELLYMAPYMDMNIQVQKWCTDEQDERFGLPELYRVNYQPMTNVTGGSTFPTKATLVHWTRCIHISEFLDQDELYGMPRLLPIFNRLRDLEKVVGGSAECFWLTANRGIAVWADKDAKLSPEAKKTIKADAEDYANKLNRVMVGQGMTAEVLGSEDPDPGPNAEVLLKIIAGAAGMPLRILTGSEAGELASSQDESNWGSRVDERRQTYATPVILRPLIEVLIVTGNIPKPKGQWDVEWGEANNLGPVQESAVMLNKTQALVAYSNAPGAVMVVPQEEFRTDFLGMSPESEYMLEETELDEDDEDAVAQVDPETGEPIPAQPGTVTTGPGGVGDGKVQDTALNGTQIASLKEIVEAVGAKQLPAETAVQLILVSFPMIDEATARKIIAPMENFEPPAPEPIKLIGQQPGDQDPIPGGIKPKEKPVPDANASLPRSLYVRRDVLNVSELQAWAKSQGIELQDGLHCTVAYSTSKVDWTKAYDDNYREDAQGNLMIHPGGVRIIEHIGPKGAVALLFVSSDLGYRHASIMASTGAAEMFEDFQPHITLFYDPMTQGRMDTLKFDPYKGALALGPEQWEEVE